MKEIKKLLKKDEDKFLPGNEVLINGKKRKITSLVFEEYKKATFNFINGDGESVGCPTELLFYTNIIENNKYSLENLLVYDFNTKLKSSCGFEGYVKEIILEENRHIRYCIKNGGKYIFVDFNKVTKCKEK